jgi:hypothetical protein
MKVKALRGVCIGVNRNLISGETADLDPATVQFLINIGAVALVAEEPPAPEAPALEPAPIHETSSKAGKTGSKEK